MSLIKMAKRVKQTVNDTQQAHRDGFRSKINGIESNQSVQRVSLQALADEKLENVEQFQEFGFTSNPPQSTEAIVIPLGGTSTHSIVVATENGSFRIKNLQSGEVAVYDESGSSIVLKQGRLIEINCDNLRINASQKVEINSPLTQTSAVLTAQGQINGMGGMSIIGGSGGASAIITGSLHATGDIKAGNISLQNHKHMEQGDGKETSAAR